LANHNINAKFKSHQFFIYSISIVILVDFEWFRQINISQNPLFQQIAKYYIHQYLFLYSILCSYVYSQLHIDNLYILLFDFSFIVGIDPKKMVSKIYLRVLYSGKVWQGKKFGEFTCFEHLVKKVWRMNRFSQKGYNCK